MPVTHRQVDVVVIGAGQAGLSAGYHLARYGFAPESGFVLLDHADAPGGAWQYRWESLTMAAVHGVHELPGMPVPAASPDAPAARVIPAYFRDYEKRFELPVHRPVSVSAVRYGPDDRLLVDSSAGRIAARVVINATGTWQRPFWPYYPGRERFAGRQLHAVDYRGAAEFTGQHVVVVGAGASATQLLAEISQVASTTWVTRRPTQFRTGPFTAADGRAAVARVDRRVRAGLLPGSVVGATGLVAVPAVGAAMDRGVFRRHPMFDHITPTGVAWDDGTEVAADAIVWATGFRPVIDHLAPLGLREAGGGIAVADSRAVREPRLLLAGYGPSASTIGANRAGRTVARAARAIVGSDSSAAVGPATPTGH